MIFLFSHKSDRLKDQNTLALSPLTETRQDALSDDAQSQRRETEQHAKQECAYAMLTPRTNTVYIFFFNR